MARTRFRVQLYVHGVVLAALALSLWFGPTAPWRHPSFWAIALAVVVLRVVAQFHPVELSHTTKVNVCAAIDVALLMTLGPAATTVVAPAAVAGGVLLTRRRAYPWLNSAFNAADYLLAAGLGGLVHHTLAAPGAPLTSVASGLAAAAGGLTYFVVNVGLVATAIGLTNQQETLRGWLGRFVHAAPQQLTLVALGILGAVVFAVAPPATPLLLVPLAVMYYTQKSSLAIRAETDRALESLASTVDQRDPYTARHSERVALYTAGICKQLGLPSSQTELVVRSARIHDIGKLAVTPSVLHKPGRLEPWEWEEIKQHPVVGASMVSGFSDYANGKDFILYHHEHLDGTGYPNGLGGGQIPLGARIIAVADSFDAMTSDRPYRKALTLERAVSELQRCASTQFDPLVVAAFVVAFPPDTWRPETLAPDLAPVPAPTPA